MAPISAVVTALFVFLTGAPSVPQVDGTEAVLERRDGSLERRPLRRLTAADIGPDGACVVRLERATVDLASADTTPADRAEVGLIGGEALMGRVVEGMGETLAVELTGNVPLSLTIDDLERLVFGERIPAGRTLAPPDEGDRLYLRRGPALDKVDGTFEAFTPTGVRFLGREDFPWDVPWDEVAALFIEPLGEGAEEAPAQRPVSVDLIDGSRLRGDLRELGATGCLVELRGGQVLALPADVLVEIALDDGSIAYLSDLRPAVVEEPSPFGDEIGMRWPHRTDRSVTGAPLRAGGRVSTRGIGVHAPSRLVWELGGSWSSLRGRVALDDQVLDLPARAEASVEFRIWLDRDPAADAEPDWTSGVVRAGREPVPIDGLDLAGVERLVLEVDMADHLHIGDRADWLGMLLVRE